jgi:zinc-ribbon domain
MVQCPNCGIENPEGSRFCNLCHNELLAPAGAPGEWNPEPLPMDVPRPSHRSKRKAVKGRSIFIAGSILLAGILGIVLYVVIFGSSGAAPEKYVTYASSTSGLTFKYPSTWEKKDVSFLGQFYLQMPDPSLGNEIVVIKRGDALFKNLCVASSSPVDPASEWDDIKGSIQEAYSVALRERGGEARFNDLAFQSGEAKGFRVDYTLEQQMGTPSLHLEAVMLRGSTLYRLVLETPLSDGDSSELEARRVFSKLLESVSIK